MLRLTKTNIRRNYILSLMIRSPLINSDNNILFKNISQAVESDLSKYCFRKYYSNNWVTGFLIISSILFPFN